MLNLLPIPVPAIEAPHPLLLLAFEAAGPALFVFFLLALGAAVTLSFTHD